MVAPEVVWTPDGHYRRVIYSIGPYIADYPEQALLTCIVQGWCPRYVAIYLYGVAFEFWQVVQQRPQASTLRVSAGHKNLPWHC